MATRKRHGLYRREGDIYAFRYKDHKGKWKEKSTGKRDYQLAKNFKDEYEDGLKEHELPTEKSDWTVAQACTRWVEQHSAHLGSAKAKRNEYSLLRQVLRRLGTRKLKTVSLDEIKTYQADRHQEVGERTVNLELRILMNTMKEANIWNPIAKH